MTWTITFNAHINTYLRLFIVIIIVIIIIIIIITITIIIIEWFLPTDMFHFGIHVVLYQ